MLPLKGNMGRKSRTNWQPIGNAAPKYIIPLNHIERQRRPPVRETHFTHLPPGFYGHWKDFLGFFGIFKDFLGFERIGKNFLGYGWIFRRILKDL